MLKDFYRKARACMEFKKNKKGLTLVELIIAVAILGLVISPLLHSFVTAQTIENKARKIGEATNAAQNIQEVLDSTNVFSFSNGSDELKQLLNCDSMAQQGDGSVEINSIKSGTGEYDAKVIFGEGIPGADDRSPLEGSDAFFKLNYVDIVDYCEPDGSFAQPFSDNADPDKIADTFFKADTNQQKYDSKKREIIVDISADYSDPSAKTGIQKTYVMLTYRYIFEYKKSEVNSSGIAIGVPIPVQYTKDIVYSVIPAGADPHSDGSMINVYIMYYPYYQEGKYDNIIVNNKDDIPIKLFLVKQWSMIKSGNNYVEMPATDLLLKENTYLSTIEEHRSSGFDLNNAEKNLYTNAMICLYSPTGRDIEIPGVNYIQYAGKERYASNSDKIKDGSVVGKTNEVRIYDVTIELYEAGSDELISKFKSSKLN